MMKTVIMRTAAAAFFALAFIAAHSQAQPKPGAPIVTVYQDPT